MSYGGEELPFFELGYFFLLGTALQLLVVSFVLILVPLMLFRRRKFLSGIRLPTILYFGGIGLGYMAIEMVMIQKLVLFLGHPVYAVSIVIAAMLLFSGLGSGSSYDLSARFRPFLSVSLVSVVCLLFLYVLLLPWLTDTFLTFSFPGRILVSVVMIAPIAFFLGTAFPLGLRRFGRISQDIIPWAWAVNGCLSVAGASLSILASSEFGFRTLQIAAAAFYAIALLASWSTVLRSTEGGLASTS
jgi:hypothetical protein